MLHPEWLLLIGYIDSLFAERTVIKGQPLGTLPDTLTQLYLQAMRHHAREAALLARGADLWQAMPDWRFDRHVIRVTLYLQERVGLRAGDRVAIVAEPGPEWLIADCAALAAGAVSVAIDPSLPARELVGALVDAGPKVIFASAAALTHLDGGTVSLPGLAEVIALGGAKGDGVRTYNQVLELGGTLDTAERAQAFRAGAKALTADQPALCHHDATVKGRVAWQELTQGAAVERIAALWRKRPAQKGDRVYLASPVVTLPIRLSLHAWLGDGYTMVVLGTAGRTGADLTEIGPHRIVAPPSLLGEMVQGAPAPPAAPAGEVGWRERARQLLQRGRDSAEHHALREALGGRIRAIDSTGPLDPALARQLRNIAAVGSAMD